MISLTRRYVIDGKEEEVTVLRGYYENDPFDPRDYDLRDYVVYDFRSDSKAAVSDGVARTISNSSDVTTGEGSLQSSQRNG